jgi:hypothetical protein
MLHNALKNYGQSVQAPTLAGPIVISEHKQSIAALSTTILLGDLKDGYVLRSSATNKQQPAKKPVTYQ